MKITKTILPIALMCSLSACTQAQILTDLDFASVAFAAVASVPGLSPLVVKGLDDAGTELACVSSAVETGGTTAQVSSAIATCGLSLVSTIVPAGTPTTIVNVLTALNNAILKVIADSKAMTTAMISLPNGFSNSFASKDSNGKFSLGMGGKEKIKKVKDRIAAAKAKIHASGK